MNAKNLDNELIAKFKSGCENSYLELVNKYSQKAHNLAMRITRNPEDAEEVLQDVFVTVYRKIDKFEGKSAFSSWLYRITANTAFMKLRKRKQYIACSIEDINPEQQESWMQNRSELADVDVICCKHELRGVLETAVARLPDDYKLIFILRDIDGLSNEEVGDIVDLSIPAVKSRLHRARLMLRRRLQAVYDEYNNKPAVIRYGDQEKLAA